MDTDLLNMGVIKVHQKRVSVHMTCLSLKKTLFTDAWLMTISFQVTLVSHDWWKSILSRRHPEVLDAVAPQDPERRGGIVQWYLSSSVRVGKPGPPPQWGTRA